MAIQGLGTTLTWTNAAGDTVAIGQLTAIGAITCDREMIDITTLTDTAGRRSAPGLIDCGEVTLTGLARLRDGGQTALLAAWRSGEEGTAIVRFANGDSASFAALVRSVALGGAETQSAVPFKAVLRVQGGIAFAEALD